MKLKRIFFVLDLSKKAKLNKRNIENKYVNVKAPWKGKMLNDSMFVEDIILIIASKTNIGISESKKIESFCLKTNVGLSSIFSSNMLNVLKCLIIINPK